MPQFFAAILALAPTAISILGVVIALTTAIHVALLALSALPLGAFASWCSKAASIIGVVAIDLQKALAFLSPYLPSAKSIGKSGLVLLVLLVTGCSQVGQCKDPTTCADACQLGSDVLAVLTSIANAEAVPLAFVEEVFSAMCATGGQDAGVAAAKAAAHAARLEAVQFPEMGLKKP